MSDRPSPLERLSVASSSSDLTVDPDHRGDVDYIVALGIAASRNGSVASPLTSLHLSTSPTSMNAAFSAVLGLVKRVNGKRNWRLNGQSSQVVALHALSHHVDPTCNSCKGRKFEVMEGAPALSSTPCRHCKGTGKRPIQKKYREQIQAVLAMLEAIDETTQRAVGRLVR